MVEQVVELMEEVVDMDDKEKPVLKVQIRATFIEHGKDIFPQELATLSEDNKPVLKILQNLDNGSYVFNYKGKNYQLDLMDMANNFVKEMRSHDSKN